MTSPVRYCPLNDLENVGVDQAGNSEITLENVNGVTTATDSTFGEVCVFDGTSYLALPLSCAPSEMYTDGSSWSASVWAKNTLPSLEGSASGNF